MVAAPFMLLFLLLAHYFELKRKTPFVILTINVYCSQNYLNNKGWELDQPRQRVA